MRNAKTRSHSPEVEGGNLGYIAVVRCAFIDSDWNQELNLELVGECTPGEALAGKWTVDLLRQSSYAWWGHIQKGSSVLYFS